MRRAVTAVVWARSSVGIRARAAPPIRDRFILGPWVKPERQRWGKEASGARANAHGFAYSIIKNNNTEAQRAQRAAEHPVNNKRSADTNQQ